MASPKGRRCAGQGDRGRYRRVGARGPIRWRPLVAPDNAPPAHASDVSTVVIDPLQESTPRPARAASSNPQYPTPHNHGPFTRPPQAGEFVGHRWAHSAARPRRRVATPAAVPGSRAGRGRATPSGSSSGTSFTNLRPVLTTMISRRPGRPATSRRAVRTRRDIRATPDERGAQTTNRPRMGLTTIWEVFRGHAR